MTENTRGKLRRLSSLRQRLTNENLMFENTFLINKIVTDEKERLISRLKIRAKQAGLSSDMIKEIFESVDSNEFYR